MIQGETRAGEVPAASAGVGRLAGDGARKRAAVELIARHEATLKRTARRYSLDAEDAEDAYQRALEIVLTKAPTTDARDLIRWTQTVTKHEALAVRQQRERLLGYPLARDRDGGPLDPVALIPAVGDGPDEQTERRETVARTREALHALKPAERRALTLLAEGYSYAEIGEITGFSPTKINRCLAEGRERFRALLSSSEDGSRCRELRPLLSAFCDGEAGEGEAAAVREHLRACASCRATMRAYRAAPRVAVALFPALPPSRSLLGRVQDLFSSFSPQIGLAKQVALCAAVVGGATACVATGVLPASPQRAEDHLRASTIGHKVRRAPARKLKAVDYEPAKPKSRRHPASKEEASQEVEGAVPDVVEYEAPEAPVPPAATPEGGTESGAQGGSAAGEFGP